ncbi:hypothetical protein WA158_005827 [Blastocystis sp. Blastoise]
MLYPIELCFNQKLTPSKFRGVVGTNYSDERNSVNSSNAINNKTTITEFFASSTINSCSMVYNKENTSLLAQKLGSISRLVSNGFEYILSNSSSLADIIEDIYIFFPEQYQIATQNKNFKCQLGSISSNNQADNTRKSSVFVPSSTTYYYPIPTIKNVLDKNIELFGLIRNTIYKDDEDQRCMKSMIERWRNYIDHHLEILINPISYVIDYHLFLDAEVYKCPSLKSLFKHNETYNKFILYNTSDSRWYCISCLLFSNDPMLNGAIYSASVINNHKNLKSHKNFMKNFKKLINNLINNQTLLLDNSNCISNNNKRVWKCFFTIIFDCMCTCLSSIHSIYGDTTSLSSPHCDGTTCNNIEELVVTIRYCDESQHIFQYFLSLVEETSPSGLKIAQDIKNV